MCKTKKIKFNIKLFICFCMIFCFAYLVYGVNYKVKALASDVVTITYTNPSGTGSNVSVETSYDDRLYSMLLIDYGTSGTENWSHSDITLSEEGKDDISYKASFAGWKLSKINGENYTGTVFFYPDHDYVYMNDAPFVSVSDTITSLEFEALWGKTVYLRDKYNYVNIKEAYGAFDGAGAGVAKINWDTLEQSNDNNNGESAIFPVSTLKRAEEIIGTNGGKIIIVNHYTFEAGKGSDSIAAYAYETGFKNTGLSVYEEIGKDIKNGVLTITGEKQGKLNEDVLTINGVVQSKNASNHTDASIYIKNTRGNAKYNGALYEALSYHLRLNCNIVLEHLNCAAYRESYLLNGGGGSNRHTADLRIYCSSNNRNVFEESFKFYKLGTDGNGLNNGDYSLTSGHGGIGTFQIWGSYNATNGANSYITMYGSVSEKATSTKNSVNYIYGNTKSAVSNLNNIHISLHNFYFSNTAGNYYQSNVNYMGYYVNNCNITSGDKKYITTIGNSSNTTTPATINEFTCVVDKDKNVKSDSYINNIFVGGVSNASDGSLLNFNVKKASVYVDNAGEVRNIYGGGNQIGTLINVDELYYKVNSGKVNNIYGGGLGGFVGTKDKKAKITIDIDGGSVGNVYGGGSGGLVNLYKTNGPNKLSAVVSTDIYRTSNEYGNNVPQFFIQNGKPVISSFVTSKNNYMPFTLSNYVIKETGISYQCISSSYVHYSGKDSDYNNLVNYYQYTFGYAVSDAAVVASTIDINLNSGTVTSDVYGGGKNGSVTGDININLNGTTVNGNIYGGGEGLNTSFAETLTSSASFKVVFSNNSDYFSTEKFIDYLNSNSSLAYHTAKNFNSAFESRKFMLGSEYKNSDMVNSGYYKNGELNIYSDTIDKLGKIIGNTNVVLTSGTVKGSVFGGSNGEVANISDDTKVLLNGATVNGVIFGGGNNGVIGGNTNVTITSGKLTSVYGGGNNAAVLGSDGTNVEVNGNVTIDSLFGGGNKGASNKTSVNIKSGNITTLYGGANEADVNGNVSLIINGGKITDTFGGNNASGKIKGNISVNVTNINDGVDGTTNLYGGGNKADFDNTVNLVFNSGKVTNLYGGGKEATIGSSVVTVNNGTVETLFGGGDQGQTLGNINVNVLNGNINTLYGGANKANIAGNVNVDIDGGVIINTFGGNNISEIISGNISLTVDNLNSLYNGNEDTYLYGGGNLANYEGLITLTFNSGKVTNLYGGGKKATIGKAKVTVNDGVIDTLFGGGDEGKTLADVIVNILSGNINTVYGGANKADVVGNIYLEISDGIFENVYGGNNESGIITGNISVLVNNGTITNLYGGGNKADFSKVVKLTVTKGTITNLYGGGKEATIGSSVVTVNNGTVETLFGGGDQGDTTGDVTVNIKDGSVETIYGGANEADIAGSANLTINGGNITTVYGGNNASGDISGSINLAITSGVIETLYGGGNVANFNGLVTVTVSGGLVSKNLYGGGKNANIKDSSVFIKGGTIDGNVYGGGYAGTSDITSVTIENDEGKIVVIGNSVFGGGEGITATVYTSSNVNVELDFTFTALESEVTVTSGETSGEIKTNITFDSNQSVIKGSVYGGGDLGQVGVGTIDLGSNSANISKVGTSKVVINNGHIEGSVFGAGNGVPSEGITYKVEMGAIFGKTSATVYGGYIEGNLYGGGRQSRLYAENGSLDNVATVLIDEQNSKQIAIKGSVFGGGDRGSSTTTNASVPTTIGNVLVTINGDSSGSKIYFIDGGVYGDGNLCLVSGNRKIEIVNFTLNAEKKLKTFYSLQRADEVIINNSDFVLLGAIDLVEEGDYTIYSVNRIDSIKMKNGSTIKLSRIVKLLGEIESDVDTNRKFISKGNNGSNEYVAHGGTTGELNILKQTDIDSYRADKTLNKNTICVANGLYLEIKETETVYGAVKGLFTLELLYANPGEGGGFVYSDILSSTGDFICETVRAFIYNAVTDLDKDDFVLGKYYVRKNARTYELATSYEAGLIYYTRQSNTSCMDVIDNVGGKLNLDKFEYYYWYIAGTVINYEVSVEGFIGSPETEFKKDSIIPEHKEDLAYIIFGITEGENQVLTKALNPDTGYYTLVQKNTGLKDQEIAIEVFIGGVSAGYLVYNDGKWGISLDNANMFGYMGRISDIGTNVLACLNTQSPKNNVELVLHKATTVNTEQRDLYFSIEVDIYKRKVVDGVYSYEAYTEGTSTLVFNTNVSIIRLVPVQSTYSDEARFYNGVGINNENIRINGFSSITVEYQTAYIPLAYPYIEGTSSFDWMLSTLGYSYYFNSTQGTYLTMCGETVVNISGTLTYDGSVKESSDDVSTAKIYKNSLGEYWYKDSDEAIYVLNNNTVTTVRSLFPKGTKITLIDLTDDKNPTYFYYICMGNEEVINLNDFYLMGSNSLKLETYGSTFKKSYNEYQKLATRVTERLVFTFDFSNTIWSDNEFSGLVQLSHMYDNNTGDDIKAIDIMDYVNLVDSGIGNEKVYNRATPKAVGYSVLVNSHGIDDFIINIDSEIYEFGEEEFSVILEESDTFIDTRYGEGEYAVKIELFDSLGKIAPFPEGLLFMVTDASGNKVYIGPDKDNIFAVIPFARYASLIDGKLVCKFKVINELYSLNNYKDSSGKVNFRISLYNAADSHYLNYLATNKYQDISFILKEEVVYSINGSLDNNVINSGEKLVVNVSSNSSQNNNEIVTYELQIKDSNGYSNTNYSGEFINGKNEILINENLNSGTYRIVIRYGDKKQYLNFIIE